MNETKTREQVLEILKQSRCHHIMKCAHSGHLDAVKADELFTAALEAKEREIEVVKVEKNEWWQNAEDITILYNRLVIERDILKADLEQSKRLHKDALAEGWALAKEVDTLKAEAERLRADRNHWKANHDNQVKLRAALLDRPDLKERARLVVALVEERDEARRLLGEARAYLTNATMDDDSLMAAIRAFLQDPALARMMGEVGK